MAKMRKPKEGDLIKVAKSSELAGNSWLEGEIYTVTSTKVCKRYDGYYHHWCKNCPRITVTVTNKNCGDRIACYTSVNFERVLKPSKPKEASRLELLIL